MSIYDFELTDSTGEIISLDNFKNKILIIVNTATHCGFTPQYKELESLYEKYHNQGLEIIDIPCNQFAGQTPENDEEIKSFCTLKYNTQFLLMKKADVNGKEELPLYTYLKQQQGFKGFGNSAKGIAMSVMLRKIDWHYKENSNIKWNFTKFVVDRKGNVIERFEPTSSMDELEKCIVKNL